MEAERSTQHSAVVKMEAPYTVRQFLEAAFALKDSAPQDAELRFTGDQASISVAAVWFDG